MLRSTLIAVALAVGITGLAAWRLGRDRFRAMPRMSFVVGSALFWGIFAAVLLGYYWSMYYAYFAPPWYRVAAPLISIVLYPLYALLIRWASLRLPGSPSVTFCLLGGLEAIPEHVVAIYRFRILDVPVLQGSSPGSVLVFAYFEYVVYWGVVLMLIATVSRLVEWIRSRPQRRLAGR